MEDTKDSIGENKTQLTRRFSNYIDLSTVSEVLTSFQSLDIDHKKEELMKEKFGRDFRLTKCLEAETINFNFTNIQDYSKFSITFCVLFFLVFLPYLAYLFNYWYYYSFISRNLIGRTSPYQQVWEIFYLILTVVLDLAALSMILMVFNQKYFLRTSEMYQFRLIFNVFYILMTNIIVPNMALKDSFEQITNEQSFT